MATVVLNGTTTALEYSLDAGTTWTVCTAPTTDLTPRINEILPAYGIRVRVKATGITPPGTPLYLPITQDIWYEEPTMPESSEYTALRFWRENAGKVGIPSNNVLHLERFRHVNRAIEDTLLAFADLVAPSYMVRSAILGDEAGKYSTTTGTYTVSTKTISAMTMSTAFNAVDVGKKVTFRIGTSVYEAEIAAYVSATSIRISGPRLPSANGTINMLLLYPAVLSGQQFSLSQFRIMQTGQQMRLDLHSTATKDVHFTTPEALRKFRPSSDENRKRIVWALQGQTGLIDKGADLSNFGILSLSYPALPDPLASDSTNLPIFDGPIVGIAGIRLQVVVVNALKAEGIPVLMPDFKIELGMLVESLYRAFNRTASLEDVKTKMSALL